MKQWKNDKGYRDKLPENSKIVIAEDEEQQEQQQEEELIDMPRRSPRNTETLVSSIPSPHEKDIRIKHEPELQGGFKALSEKGIRITNYHEELP
jgi:hypothetical protein